LSATPLDPHAAVLAIRDLRTSIRQDESTVHAVDGVSLHINAGETVGLVGESGSGKSMTAMSIMRLLPARGSIVGGSILLNGRDITRLGEREMRHVRGNEVAMIFQDPLTSLNPTMTIGDQIVEAVLLHKPVGKANALKRAEEVLELVRVPRPKERLGSYPHQLSGGLRQRVMIAIALSCSPRLLIADEPTTALDVTIQAQILDLIEDLKRRLDMAVLLITHDLGVVAGRADRVSVMYAGSIVEEAPVDDLFSNTHHPYTEALLAAIPRPADSKAAPLYAIPGQPPDLAGTFDHCVFAPRCRYGLEDCSRFVPALSATGDHRQACFHPVGAGAQPSQIQRREATA
jgi:oligopeptide/dipeptide ABC transporter ATP-binding protein